MASLLVDTDVFIDHLRGAKRLVPGPHRIHYSVITRCELFAGTRGDEAVIRALLEPFAELSLGPAIAERAGRIRRDLGVRIADALIGATALEHRLSLVTRNARDYQRIPSLKLRPPGEVQESPGG